MNSPGKQAVSDVFWRCSQQARQPVSPSTEQLPRAPSHRADPAVQLLQKGPARPLRCCSPAALPKGWAVLIKLKLN